MVKHSKRIKSNPFQNTPKQLQTKNSTRVSAICGLDGTRTRDPMRDRHVF